MAVSNREEYCSLISSNIETSDEKVKNVHPRVVGLKRAAAARKYIEAEFTKLKETSNKT